MSRFSLKSQRSVILALFLSVVSFNISAQQETTTSSAENAGELITDLEDKAKGFRSSDPSSYEINGSALLGGPGPDDVAANMALMAFGHPVKKIMDDRFNGINASSTDSDVTLITHLATITTSLALFFTSLMLLAALTGGVINTGKDGELLGKDWDHKLFPLRASFHTAFLIPLPGFAGLCGIQVFMVFLGLLGLGIGGITFTSGAKFLSNGNQIVTYQERDINALSEQIMSAALCDSINQRMVNDTDLYVPGLTRSNLTDSIAIDGATSRRQFVSGVKFEIGGDGKCGNYEINYLPPGNAQFDADVAAARAEFNVDNVQSDIIKGAVFKHLIEDGSFEDFFGEVKTIIDTPEGIADRFADDQEYDGQNGSNKEFTNDEVNALEAARVNFYNGVVRSFAPSENPAIAAEFEALNATFVEEVSRFGFAFFFKYYYELSSRQEVTSGAVKSLLNAQNAFNVPWDIDYCNAWFFWSSDTCDASKKANKVQKRVQRGFHQMYEETNILYSNALGAMVDNKDFSPSTIEEVTFYLAQELTQVPRDVNPDPIVEVKWLGDTLTSIGDAVFLFTARVKAVADAADAATSPVPGLAAVAAGIKSFLTSVISKIWVGLLPLFGLAFAYAYIIPSIPVIFGFVAVFSYFVYWALAIYHSPFWYAMGVMPKGDGLMGRANTGYSMAVNLLLMPAFMIIGFFTGMALMKVFGWYVSISFFDAMADVNRAGGVNDFSLSKIVGIFVVYGTIYTILIWKCFGMIFETSNTLSQWMGTNNRTDFGENEAKTTALSASGVAGQKFGESAVHMNKEGNRQDKAAKDDMRQQAGASTNGGGSDGGSGKSPSSDHTSQLERQLSKG